MFTKKDLKSGMMAVTKNENRYIVIEINGHRNLVSVNGYNTLNNYADDLTYSGYPIMNPGYNIDKVYSPIEGYAIWCFFKLDYKGFKLVWDRSEEEAIKQEFDNEILTLTLKDRTVKMFYGKLSELWFVRMSDKTHKIESSWEDESDARQQADKFLHNQINPW